MRDPDMIATESAHPVPTPIVSIIVATKCDLANLQRFMAAVDGLLSAVTELIIVDGGFGDGTAEWLCRLKGEAASAWVTAVSELDSGIAEAWNRGVRVARGHWLVFLGADDRIADAAAWRAAIDRLGTLPPACSVVAFPVRIVTPGGAMIAHEDPRLGAGGGRFPAVNAIPYQGAFHRRSL